MNENLKNELYKIATDNPIVYLCLQKYEHGELSFEDALMNIAIISAKQNEEIKRMAADVLRNNVTPINFQADPALVESIKREYALR